MLDTKLIRAKIDRLSAADGADTYWRETMLEALDEIDELKLRARLGILNRARDIEQDLNPGEISDEANYLRRLVTSDISLEECQRAYLRVKARLQDALLIIQNPDEYQQALKMLVDLFEAM